MSNKKRRSSLCLLHRRNVEVSESSADFALTINPLPVWFRKPSIPLSCTNIFSFPDPENSKTYCRSPFRNLAAFCDDPILFSKIRRGYYAQNCFMQPRKLVAVTFEIWHVSLETRPKSFLRITPNSLRVPSKCTANTSKYAAGTSKARCGYSPSTLRIPPKHACGYPPSGYFPDLLREPHGRATGTTQTRFSIPQTRCEYFLKPLRLLSK